METTLKSKFFTLTEGNNNQSVSSNSDVDWSDEDTDLSFIDEDSDLSLIKTVEHVATIRSNFLQNNDILDELDLNNNFLSQNSNSHKSISDFKISPEITDEELSEEVDKIICSFKTKDCNYDFDRCLQNNIDNLVQTLQTQGNTPKTLECTKRLSKAIIKHVLPQPQIDHSRPALHKSQITPLEFHIRAFQLQKDNSKFRELFEAIISIQKVENVDPPHNLFSKEIINIQHLIEVEERGFHLCPNTHIMHSQLMDIKNSPNNSFQAQFQTTTGKLKTSTFFPLDSPDELIKLIGSAETIAREKNRFLCQVPNYTFLIEMYKEGPVIKSAFPIFYYHLWQGNEKDLTIVKEKEPIAAQSLFDRAIKALNAYNQDPIGCENPIRYKMQDLAILDLAPHLKELGVTKGIFIAFPSNILPIRELFSTITNRYLRFQEQDHGTLRYKLQNRG